MQNRLQPLPSLFGWKNAALSIFGFVQSRPAPKKCVSGWPGRMINGRSVTATLATLAFFCEPAAASDNSSRWTCFTSPSAVFSVNRRLLFTLAPELFVTWKHETDNRCSCFSLNFSPCVWPRVLLRLVLLRGTIFFNTRCFASVFSLSLWSQRLKVTNYT